MSGPVGDNTARASGVIASAGGGGKFQQIVITSSNAAQAGTTSTSFVDLPTNITVSITPTAADSSIWIWAMGKGSCGGGPAGYEIDRDSGTQVIESGLSSSNNGYICMNKIDLAGASGTSTLVYKIRYKNTGGASGHNTYWEGGSEYKSYIMAIEILA